MAIILITVPSSYVPPVVETLPPSAAEAVKLYWVTVGVVTVGVSNSWCGCIFEIYLMSMNQKLHHYLLNMLL